MPTATADTAATPQGVAVTIAVLANDEGDTLTVTGYSAPAFGTLVLNPDQSFTYTPVAGFFGSDGFSYTIGDQAGATATGQVTIGVTRPNTVPTPGEDAAHTAAGTSVVLPVLDNDADPDGDALSLIAIEAPGHGTVQVEPGGQRLRYTPQVGFVGSDSFAYTVSDGWGGSATANVTIDVTPLNTAPVPAPDRASTLPGTAVTIDVLANDDDAEGGPLTLTGITLPAHGALALTGEQQFIYTPEPGFVGEDGFTYTVRDAGGLTATGSVTVEVTPHNQPPTAQDDQATLSDGLPLRLDLVANDNDPDGDPLRITGLSLPAGGRIAVNPDQSVTYTPLPGFAGTDSFTYKVSDGSEEALAEVTVEVIPPTGATFANGYRCRRRLLLPARGEALPVTDTVLLVQETGSWLRPVAAGGGIESATGLDLRFETAGGTRLEHELEAYDPEAGSITAWVRLPAWSLDQTLELALYYGKPGLTAAEGTPGGTWRGYLAVWDSRTGNDRTGRGRSLLPVNIQAGELIAGCGRFDGQSVARRPDAAFLSGLGAITVQALLAPAGPRAGSDHGILAQGPMTGVETAAGLGLGYRATGEDGAERVLAFRLRCADGDTVAYSAGGNHGGDRQLVHATWHQGAAAALYLDGAASASSGGPARAGLTAMPAGGLQLGAGPRDSANGGWQGLLDEVRIRPEALPAAWIAFEAMNLARPQACYGLGGEDRADDASLAPVAMPLAARVSADAHVDLDPLAAMLAIEAEGEGEGPVLAAVESPAMGKTTIVDGRLRYTPRAGFLGTERFAYTLRANGKLSLGLVTVTVTAPAVLAVDDLASTRAGEAVAIDALRNDEGAGLALRSLGTPAHGTASLNAAGGITYRPAEGFLGTDSFTYRAGNELGESEAVVSVTVTDGAADLPYAYVHKPADGILPASDADIVVWNIPAAGGTCPYVGNTGQVLLMVAPATPIRGTVSATNLQFKAVFLIGASFRPQGITSLLTPAGSWVRGGDLLRIGFAAGIGVKPVLFLANIDHDARNATESNVFGDFLQVGTARPQASAEDPDGSANRGAWVDVYLQKIKVAHGSLSFPGGSAGAPSLLSSFLRPRLGGVGDIYAGQLDLRWHGPAFLLQGYPAPRDTVAPDARLLLHRVALRSLGAVATTGDRLAAPPFFHLTGEAATAEAATAQLERGNYQAALFDQVSLERYPEADGGSLTPYFVPGEAPGGAVLRYDSATRSLAFPSYRGQGRRHPIWTGAVAVSEGREAMVTDAEIGAGLRVTGAARLRAILAPRQELQAVADSAATVRGRAVEIDLLANDLGTEGATLGLGNPGFGTVTAIGDGKVRYIPAAGRIGSDGFGYTLSRGERSSSATVSISVTDQTMGAWGAGPRSGDRWWTGFGDVTGSSLGMVGVFEQLRRRPVDIIAVWAPKNQIASWDDLAGGAGEEASQIGGTLTKGLNVKKVIWDNAATRALPAHLSLTLVPPSASNRRGVNPGVWFDYADGAFDVYWRRLGKRLAHLDAVSGRTALLVLDLGWEHTGPWYHWSIMGSRNGIAAYTRFPYAFARIVAAIRAGHHDYAGKNCPYRFCWRPSRQVAAAGVHHRVFYPGDESVDLLALSHHERDPYLTPTNWASRTSPWPNTANFNREGWDPYFDFCASRGKKACFPEWAPLQTTGEYEASPYPEEFFRLTRSYIERRLDLFAYDCFFNGDDSKITANPTWKGTTEYLKLWGRS